MKNIKYLFIAISLVGFLFSCTSEDIIEENSTNITQDIYGTGDDSSGETDNDRDGD